MVLSLTTLSRCGKAPILLFFSNPFAFLSCAFLTWVFKRSLHGLSKHWRLLDSHVQSKHVTFLQCSHICPHFLHVWYLILVTKNFQQCQIHGSNQTLLCISCNFWDLLCCLLRQFYTWKCYFFNVTDIGANMCGNSMIKWLCV